jgi:cation diffusion facilitator family transporter
VIKTTAAKPDPYAQAAKAAQRGARAAVLGICASVVLATIKIFCGVIGNAYVLIADGVESILDVFSSLVVWGSLRIAAAPPNERYPYGYGRAEPLAALVASLALLAAAIGITIESVREIITPHHAPAPFTLLILIGVVIVKELMFRRLAHTGAAIGSQALENDAIHHRSDAFTSLAAFVGIFIAWVGGPGYESADDWAALVACGVIALNGVRMFRSALTEVLDVAPPEEVTAGIRRIASNVPGVAEIDKCRVRKSGIGYFVDLHVVVDGSLPVRDGHNIAHDVKDSLLRSDLGVLDASIHIEPLD